MNGRIWRQGDLLFVESDKIPSGFSSRRSDIILKGEATGHSHRIVNGAIFEEPDKYGSISNRLITRRELFLRVENGGRVVHEEHATLELPSGIFKVIFQREYSISGWINVRD